MKLEILQETNEWIAINKPSGLLVEENKFETSLEAILKENHKFIGIVHRLDRVTSGIILVAKKRSALKILNEQFSQKIVKKTYHAIVSRKPEKDADTLVHYLHKDLLNKKAVIVDVPKRNNVMVKLDYEIIEQIDKHYLLKVNLATGKFHQIRAQLAHIGCPVLGDTKYNGSKTEQHLKSVALRANNLEFLDPITNEKVVLEITEKFRYKN